MVRCLPMEELERRKVVKRESHESSAERAESPREIESFRLEEIQNWELVDGEVCAKQVDAIPTPLWHEGWYRNPTSGRSNNYGVHTDDPKRHTTVVVKGGRFFPDEATKQFFKQNSLTLGDLYGGLSLEDAKKEYDIAALVQECFQSLLHKKAPCPNPIDLHTITRVRNGANEVVSLVDYFSHEAVHDKATTSFTIDNFLQMAKKIGVDLYYPMSEAADENARANPFVWVFQQCLEHSGQSIYRYSIEGPNTRILDLMTLELDDRRRNFVVANDALDVQDAMEKFSSKLGEFYGVLRKYSISYHGRSSEHCSLVDITIAGIVMDIGGLTQNRSANEFSESYIVQAIRTANVIAYVGLNVLKLEESVVASAVSTFWKNYNSIYVDENTRFFPENPHRKPDNIRTRYVDSLASDWVQLAPDLSDVAWNG